MALEARRESSRRLAGAVVGLALIFVWLAWCGAGGSSGQGMLLWTTALLMLAAVGGVAPLWAFLVGWPAWLAVRVLTGGRPFAAFVGLTVGLVALCRCGGKLLLLATAASPLTLSAATIPASLGAEAAANLLFLSFFSLLLGERPKASPC